MNVGRNAKPPVAAKKGDADGDPYAWLRDPNWQQVIRDPSVLDPEIRAYLEAENAYSDAALAPLADLRNSLKKEMRARIKEDDLTVPLPVDAYRYYVRYTQGGQHPIFCRTKGDEGAEQVLFDADAEAEGQAFFKVGLWLASPGHGLFAYTVDLAGGEHHRLRVCDAASGAVIEDALDGLRADFQWANDDSTLFYVRMDDQHRPRFVYRHTVGDDPAKDVCVYEETDPGFYVWLGKTESRRFIVIGTASHSETGDIRLIEADAPHESPRALPPREEGVQYGAQDLGDAFYMLTNADGAEDFKIAAAPVADPVRANWRDVVAHRPGRLILDLAVFRHHLVRLERVDALPRLVVRRIDDGDEHTIAFDEPAYDLSIVHGMPHDGAVVRFSYSSPKTPPSVFDYDLESRTRTLRKRTEVPSGHNPDDYVVERLIAPAADGEEVPVTVLYNKTTPRDDTAPLWLYGYGSYGLSMPASFQTNRLSLVDRGFVFAIAHIRGGKEKGQAWYRAGKLLNKKNTFSDFVACAEHLVKENYTSAGRIAAHGGSAGGLLMGAVVNMRPDLFGAVVADVPFVDVLATIMDDTLPLTPPEWVEWGNPIKDETVRDYMRSYSPYDNVVAQDYPAMLVTGGVSDPRVTYWEPAKWVAKLRATKTDDNPLLMHINMEAGHAGKSGRFDRLDEIARMYAFVLSVMGRG